MCGVSLGPRTANALSSASLQLLTVLGAKDILVLCCVSLLLITALVLCGVSLQLRTSLVLCVVSLQLIRALVLCGVSLELRIPPVL